MATLPALQSSPVERLCILPVANATDVNVLRCSSPRVRSLLSKSVGHWPASSCDSMNSPRAHRATPNRSCAVTLRSGFCAADSCALSVSSRQARATACLCLRSLRIRVEAFANTIERTVIEQQLRFMKTREQPTTSEDLYAADTSCPP